MSRHIYTLRKPAGWYKETWREALPIGNGLTAALITGAIGEENIIFNRFDLWEDGCDPPVPDVTEAFFQCGRLLTNGTFAPRTATFLAGRSEKRAMKRGSTAGRLPERKRRGHGDGLREMGR
ncbi:MAG: glycoside hydrolase N-terminal domain-containing protein [Clostridia bacterium]|nr:glycoside hydrolase N-terminal domain-containing protein [Clostridia bacterium]